MEEDDIFVVPPETNGSVTSREDQIAIAAAMGLDDPFGRSSTTTSSSTNTNHVQSVNDKSSKPVQGNSRGGAGPSSRPLVSVSTDFVKSGPSGGNPSKEIKFVIRNNGGANLTLSLAECETIETLKTLIHAQ